MRSLLPPLLALAVACVTGHTAPDADVFDRKPKDKRTFDGIQYFAQKGRSVNFGGAALKLKGGGDCDSQKEGMTALIEVQGDGVTLRNAVITRTPDGINVKAPNVTIENLVFTKVCEDAITANGADNLVIRNCAFRGADDKVIQLNSGRNILIEDCYFEGNAKPIRVKPGVTVTVRNNVSRGSTVFVMADGEGAVVRVEGNDVRDSEWFVKAQKGARIEVAGNRTAGIEKRDAAEDGGVVRRVE